MTAVSVAYAGDAGRGRAAPGGGRLIAAAWWAGWSAGSAPGHHRHTGWRTALLVFAALTALARRRVGRELSPLRASLPEPLARLRGMARTCATALVGAYLVGATMFFGWMGLFTYSALPALGPPHDLSTGWSRASSMVYAVGVVVSPLAGRLSSRVAADPPGGRRPAGRGARAAGHAPRLAGHHRGRAGAGGGRDLHGAGGGAGLRQPAGAHGKGGASALYLTFYYLGTLRSLLPGWPGKPGAGRGGDRLRRRRRGRAHGQRAALRWPRPSPRPDLVVATMRAAGPRGPGDGHHGRDSYLQPSLDDKLRGSSLARSGTISRRRAAGSLVPQCRLA